MSHIVYVNLPVADAARARAFYEGLGFSTVEQFTGEHTTCIRLTEGACLMLLDRETFASFAPGPGPVADPHESTGVLVAIPRDIREAVDAIVEAAVAHGGSDTGRKQEYGDVMYGRCFRDPDGNTFEPGWMDTEKMRAAMAAQKG